MTRPLLCAAPWLAVSDAVVSDIGLVRQCNEDAILRRPDCGLWAVADGMGGHEAGQWSAQVICEALETTAIAGDFGADCARVIESLQAANSVIHDRAEAQGARMGSTAAALLLDADRCALFWVGDSRIYRLRDTQLIQLTSDHTQVQALVDRGLIDAAASRKHPLSHVLTRAVGVQAHLDIGIESEDVRSGDVFLICSDGLHGVVADAEIAPILNRDPPAEACDALLSLSHARGAPDNISAIVVAVG